MWFHLKMPMSKFVALLRRYKKWLIGCAIVIMVLAVGLHLYCHATLLEGKEVVHIYLNDDDDIDTVYARLTPVASPRALSAYKTMARLTGYDKRIRPGHYEIAPGEGAFTVLRRMKNGVQTPVQLVVSPTWTVQMECGKLARQLQCDSADIAKLLTDNTWCRQHGYDTATIAAIFLPDSYEVWWNIKPEALIERMIKEHDAFWNADRRAKAQTLNLSPEQVTTLASIVDGETTNTAEKPIIAGLYYNRLQKDMLLQADPTVIFALRQFALRRIYNAMLRTESPYNTYVTKGLPPGPIRITTKDGIDAVLNMQRHHYLYMCAKEDFSGTHNFAATYAEHQANAARYVKALNERKIR